MEEDDELQEDLAHIIPVENKSRVDSISKAPQIIILENILLSSQPITQGSNDVLHRTVETQTPEVENINLEDGTTLQYHNHIRLMMLFPEIHPGTLLGALGMAKNDFIAAVDAILFARSTNRPSVIPNRPNVTPESAPISSPPPNHSNEVATECNETCSQNSTYVHMSDFDHAYQIPRPGLLVSAEQDVLWNSRNEEFNDSEIMELLREHSSRHDMQIKIPAVDLRNVDIGETFRGAELNLFDNSINGGVEIMLIDNMVPLPENNVNLINENAENNSPKITTKDERNPLHCRNQFENSMAITPRSSKSPPQTTARPRRMYSKARKSLAQYLFLPTDIKENKPPGKKTHKLKPY